MFCQVWYLAFICARVPFLSAFQMHKVVYCQGKDTQYAWVWALSVQWT